MRYVSFFLFLAFQVSSSIYSQGLFVGTNSNESLSIGENIKFHLDGLTLNPREKIIIRNNVIVKSYNETIDGLKKSYNFQNALSNFSGVLGLNYSDVEFENPSTSHIKPMIYESSSWEDVTNFDIDVDLKKVEFSISNKTWKSLGVFSNYQEFEVNQIGSTIYGDADNYEASTSVSISSNGTVVAIGSRFNNKNGINSGQVKIYNWNGKDWIQRGEDIYGEESGFLFGFDVSLSSDGNVIAIGNPFNDVNGSDSGEVRVLEWNGINWVQRGLSIYGLSENDYSGYFVSLSADGNILSVSGPGNDGSGSNSGHVRVFSWEDNSWLQRGSDIYGENSGDGFRNPVSMSSDGSILAIGYPRNDGNGDNSGSVKVLSWNGYSWSQLGNNIDGEARGDYSGNKVSISSDGSVIAISAHGNDGNGNNSGHVRVFSRDGNFWNQLGTDIDGEAGDYSGSSISLSSDGTILAINTLRGIVRIYYWDGVEWDKLFDISGEANNIGFGYSLSISSEGTVLAVTSPGLGDNQDRTGDTKIYSLSNARPYTRLQTIKTLKQSPISFQLDAGDLNGDDITYSIISPTSYGEINIDSSGLATYTTNIDSSIRDVFEYKISDGKLESNTSSVTILSNNSSSNNDINTSVVEGETVQINLNSLNPDDDYLDYIIVNQPQNGVVSVTGNIANYTPNNGNYLNDSFEFKFSDGTLESNISTVQIKIIDQIGEKFNNDLNNNLTGFSMPVSGDGSIVAVGSLINNGNGPRIPRVRVYEWNSFQWIQRGSEINGEVGSDYTPGSISLSTDGDFLAIGFEYGDGEFRDSGYVRIYSWDGNDWVQKGENIYGLAIEDWLGTEVSISSDGNVIAASAPYKNSNGVRASGQVRVFFWDGLNWVQRGQNLDGEILGGISGYSLSMSKDGSILAVGTPGQSTNFSGYVSVYKWNGDSWSLLGQVIEGEQFGEQFGMSVSLSSDGFFLAIGAPRYDGNVAELGRVQIYSWNGTSWMQVGEDINGETDHKFFGSVEISSNGMVLAVGGYKIGDNRLNSFLRIFTWDGMDWKVNYTDISNVSSFSLSSDGSVLSSGDIFGSSPRVYALENSKPFTRNQKIYATEQTLTSFNLYSGDLNQDPITYEIVTEPSFGHVNIDETGQVTYTSNSDVAVTDYFTYRANDGNAASEIASVTITIISVNDIPESSIASATTAEDTSVEITLTATDADGDALIYSVVSAPEHGTVSITGNTASYIPEANYFGSDSFTFKSNDGTVDSNTASVTIAITSVNDTPITSGVATSTLEDTSVTIALSASDVDGDELTYLVVTSPSHGTVTIDGSSALYTPQENYHGEDVFTFKANDGMSDSNVSSATITVLSVNDEPFVDPADISGLEDEDLLIELSSTDDGYSSDSDGHNSGGSGHSSGSSQSDSGIIYRITTLPVKGTIYKVTGSNSAGDVIGSVNTLLSNNKLLYRPMPNSYGVMIDSIGVSANDGYEFGPEEFITISLSNVNDTPTDISLSTNTVNENAADSVIGSFNAVDADPLDSHTFELSDNVAYPDNDLFDIVSGELKNTEAFDYETRTSYTIEVITNDPTGSTYSKTFVINVTNVNDINIEGTTTNTSCDGELGDGSISITTTNTNGTLSYQWTGPNGYESESKNITGLESGQYTLVVTDQTHSKSKIFTVTKTPISQDLSICYVSSDPKDFNKNRIYFNVSEVYNVEKYMVYRESDVANQYELIGLVDPLVDDSFLDPVADNLASSYKYKVRLEDRCGDMSNYSSSHKTILLQSSVATNKSVNLLWTAYEGIAYGTYKIYRSVNNGPFELLKSVSSSNLQYNDVDANIDSNSYRYYISIATDNCEVPSSTGKGENTNKTPRLNEIRSNLKSIVSLTSESAAPVISDQTFSVSESATVDQVIGTIEATDPNGISLTYGIVSGENSDKFALNANTIVLKSALDYETKSLYTLEVSVSNGTLSSTALINIYVEDVPNQSVEKAFTIRVYDVKYEDSASKVDYASMMQTHKTVGDTEVLYEISGGADAALFIVNTNTGALDFKEVPDFENPADADQNNIYEVTVKFTNLTDGAPEVPVVTTPTSIVVPEAQAAVTVVETVATTPETDTDGDGVVDTQDNCPLTPNPTQADQDNDGIGDVCDDSDGDGLMDSEDACPNSTPGAMIDVTGCEVFTLPKNNFNLRASAATCSGSNNGAIEVSAQDDDYTYTATITKSGTQVSQQTLSQGAGMTKSISALGTGSYQVCFTVEGQTGYSQCFSVNIAEPPALGASASVDRSARLVTLNLSGSDKYYITHNGTTTTTDKQQVTIALRSGNNTLEVNTDLGCQGTFFEEVFVSEEVIVYPNPTEGMIQVYVAGVDQSIKTELRDLSGNIRIQHEVSVPQNRVIELDLTQLPTGVYVLMLSGETVRTTEKIIKE